MEHQQSKPHDMKSHAKGQEPSEPTDMKSQTNHYLRLLAMIALSFVSMYILMYAMVDRLENVYNSFNQFYMAGLMTAPMVVLELILMGGMYKNKKLNGFLIAISLVALLIFWALIRQQAAISDRQFLRSMIPHHAGAVLMCEQNKLKDPELIRLCQDILSSQQAEILLMKSKLDRGG